MTSVEPPFGILASILARKADLFARDVEGWTAILHAVNERHYTSVAFLLKSCPKENVKDILASRWAGDELSVVNHVLVTACCTTHCVAFLLKSCPKENGYVYVRVRLDSLP